MRMNGCIHACVCRRVSCCIHHLLAVSYVLSAFGVVIARCENQSARTRTHTNTHSYTPVTLHTSSRRLQQQPVPIASPHFSCALISSRCPQDRIHDAKMNKNSINAATKSVILFQYLRFSKNLGIYLYWKKSKITHKMSTP